MLPKYGLFDFFEWHSVEVTDISNIEWGDRELPTDLTAVIEDGTVIGVKWPVAGRSGGQSVSGKESCAESIDQCIQCETAQGTWYVTLIWCNMYARPCLQVSTVHNFL